MARNTYTLYLAKAECQNFTDLLSDTAAERLRSPLGAQADIAEFADGASLFFFRGIASTPAWLREINASFGTNFELNTSSGCAVLLFHKADRIFAATFGHGWMYLNDRYLEKEFGLKAAVNALDDKKLKRLDRTNLADALRGSALSPFQREFASFGLNDALDLVRTISGTAREDASADALTGSYSLKITGDFGILELPEKAEEALSFFESDSYRGTPFEVIDLLRPVVDRDRLDLLDQEATRNIRDQIGNFELGLPADSTAGGVSYQFAGPGLRGAYSDLLLQNYVTALGDTLPTIDVETIKKHQIVAVYEDAGRPKVRWSIHSALVGSVGLDGQLYAINEGAWYDVDQAFKAAVENAFENLVAVWDQPPTPLAKEVSEDGRQRRYQSEESYNREAADRLGLVLMDRRLIATPGIQRGEFEVCDLLDIENKRLIHVKKSSRRSSVLSHFLSKVVIRLSRCGCFRVAGTRCWTTYSNAMVRKSWTDLTERSPIQIADGRSNFGSRILRGATVVSTFPSSAKSRFGMKRGC